MRKTILRRRQVRADLFHEVPQLRLPNVSLSSELRPVHFARLRVDDFERPCLGRSRLAGNLAVGNVRFQRGLDHAEAGLVPSSTTVRHVQAGHMKGVPLGGSTVYG